MSDRKTRPSKPGLLQMIFSIIAAFCGIQNYKNHERDDAHIEQVGFMPYIVVGIVMTFIFVIVLYWTVQFILN
jgi:hypothetical protein